MTNQETALLTQWSTQADARYSAKRVRTSTAIRASTQTPDLFSNLSTDRNSKVAPPSHTMFYVLRPQASSTIGYNHPLHLDLDPEDAYVERKRREYLAALQQQQERHAYERAVAAEEERHRARLAALAQQERMRHHAAPQSLAPHVVGCAGPTCAPTNIVRGRYNRPREAPQFYASAPAPIPQRSCPQSEEITLDRLVAELFGHSVHGVRIMFASDLSTPILTDIQEPEVVARKQTQPAPVSAQASRSVNPPPVPVASTSAAPAPAAPAEPTEAHWSDAVKRTRSVAAISQISRTFESLKRTFTFPAGPLTPVEGSETPRLAFNPTNAPIHAYEHALSELLTKLDTVESFGFRGVRELRKEVVVKIEKELEALEKRVAEAIAAGASPVIKATKVVAPEEPTSENQAKMDDKVGDKVAEDTMMEETEVVAAVASGGAEETAQGYDLDTDGAATVVPAPGQPTPVEPEPSSTQPQENAVDAEYQEVDSDPIITEPAVEPEVVATTTTELQFETVLQDATATVSSSETESEIEDAVDVTVSSDSDIEVSPEAGDAMFDAEKDFEML
jgi:hypothetical protein